MATIDQILRLVTVAELSGLNSLSKGFDDADSHGQSMAGHIASGLKDVAVVTAAAGVAAGGFLVAAVKSAADFQDAMAPIKNLTGASAAEVAQYQQGILDLATKIPISTKDAADALFFIASSGFKGADGLSVLTTAAQASAAGLGSVKDIASLVTAALTDYGLGADQATTITDKLTAAVTDGRASAADFGPALSKVLPIASAAGVNFDQVAASLSTMTRAGLTADEAGTALRGTLNALIKPSSGAEQALEAIGLSSDQLKDKIKNEGLMQTLDDLMQLTGGDVETLGQIIPNIRALTGVLASAGSQHGAYAQALSDEQNAAGKTADAFGKAKENVSYNIGLLKNDLQVFMITIGNALLPIVTPLITNLGNTARSFMDWLFGNRVGDVGPDGTKASLASRFTVILATILPFVSRIGSVIGSAFSGLKSVYDWIFGDQTIDKGTNAGGQAVVQTVQSRFQDIVQAIKPIFQTVTSTIGDFAGFVTGTIVPGLMAFADWFTGTAIPAVEKFATNSIWPRVQTVFGWIQDFIGWIKTSVEPAALTGIQQALGWFSDHAADFQNFWQQIEAFGTWLQTTIAPAALSGAQAAFQWIADHRETVVGALAALAVAYGIVEVAALAEGIAAAAANLPLYLIIATIALLGAGIALLITHWDEITAKFPILGQAADDVKKQLDAFVTWLENEFSPRATAAFDAVSQWISLHWANGDIAKWLQGPFEAAQAVIIGVFDFIRDTIKLQLDLITGIIQIALDLISGNWGKAWKDVKDLLGNIWTDIKQIVGDQLKATLGVLDGAWTLITTALMGPWNWFRDNIGGVISAAINFMLGPLNAGISAFNALGRGVTTAVNWVTNKLGLGDVMGSWSDVGPISVDISFAPSTAGQGAQYANGVYTPGKVGVLASGGGMADGWSWTGERGPELTHKQGSNVTVFPADVSAVMASKLGMTIPGYFLGTPDWGDALGDIAGAIKGAGSEAVSFAKEWVTKGVDKLVDATFTQFGVTAPSLPGVLAGIGPAVLSQLKDKVVDGIKQIFDKGKSALGTAQPGTPAEVDAWIQQAIAATGVDANWEQGLDIIAMGESTGNPDPPILDDVNAQAGNPSRGLMQTTLSTFASYAMPGHGNILDPVDNAIAAIRYIQARYGNIENVPGVSSILGGGPYLPYANGGVITEPITGIGKSGQRYKFGENSQEVVLAPVDGPGTSSGLFGGSGDPAFSLANIDTNTRLTAEKGGLLNTSFGIVQNSSAATADATGATATAAQGTLDGITKWLGGIWDTVSKIYIELVTHGQTQSKIATYTGQTAGVVTGTAPNLASKTIDLTNLTSPLSQAGALIGKSVFNALTPPDLSAAGTTIGKSVLSALTSPDLSAAGTTIGKSIFTALTPPDLTGAGTTIGKGIISTLTPVNLAPAGTAIGEIAANALAPVLTKTINISLDKIPSLVSQSVAGAAAQYSPGNTVIPDALHGIDDSVNKGTFTVANAVVVAGNAIGKSVFDAATTVSKTLQKTIDLTNIGNTGQSQTAVAAQAIAENTSSISEAAANTAASVANAPTQAQMEAAIAIGQAMFYQVWQVKMDLYDMAQAMWASGQAPSYSSVTGFNTLQGGDSNPTGWITGAGSGLNGSGFVQHFANGGMLNEPVIGYGMHSGDLYSLAEKQPERVVPGSGANSTPSITNHFADGAIVIPAKDLAEMQDVRDFFDRIQQVQRARGN